jgi:hypothetical protein
MSLRKEIDGPTVLFGVATAFGAYAALEFFNKRKRVLRIADSQIGETQWGQYLDGVAADPGGPVAWCGIFALWVLHEAGLGESITWRYNEPHGFLFRLPPTNDPQPGDLAYIPTNQHHAIVESVEDGWVTTIDGNSAGRKVARNRRPRSAFSAFYSIQPLIDGELS